jgi:hypothetical protein
LFERFDRVAIGLCINGTIIGLVAVLEWGALVNVVMCRVVRRAVRILKRWGWCSHIRVVVLFLLLLVGLFWHCKPFSSPFLLFFLSHPLFLVC